MKNTLKSLMSVAAAALALTSCSTDATDEVIAKGEPKTLKVNATIEQTRTTMAENHKKLQWAADDEIKLYIGEDAAEETVKKINPTTGGTITDVTYENGNTVYAYYSTEVSGKSSAGPKKVLLNINSTQKQSEAGVFAGENMPMYAKGTIQNGEVELTFQPLACVLVFNVYGPAAQDEKIKSIKFNTTVGCRGYDNNMCDLTGPSVEYKPYSDGKSATVELDKDNYASIGASKPTEGNTITAENQIYLVVAPVKYPAGSTFTVTTTADQYTFTTTTELDCSTTARVVNLNLAKATNKQPAINVPTVNEQPSAGVSELEISGITFRNIEVATTDFDVKVYKDKELTTIYDNPWITIPNTGSVKDGVLKCTITSNSETTPRTAYIGIKCADAQAAIAITQVGDGSTPVSTASLTLEDIKAAGTTQSYKDEHTITAADGSVWTGHYVSTSTYLQLGWSKKVGDNAAKSYLLVPDAGKVIKKITFTPEGTSKSGLKLALMPENYTYPGGEASVLTDAAYASSTESINGSTEPISIDLTGLNLTRFMIRAVGGPVRLTNITIEYAE